MMAGLSLADRSPFGIDSRATRVLKSNSVTVPSPVHE